ncbi:MAG: hypothetical protein GY847_01775 [Proteobacteria bacterium]|nr:hypothetical protein [Pseudomonadota bacterium]
MIPILIKGLWVFAWMISGAAMIYAGQRLERRQWLNTSRKNEYLEIGTQRFFVFDATDFDIIDERKGEIIKSKQGKKEKEDSRFRKALRLLKTGNPDPTK